MIVKRRILMLSAVLLTGLLFNQNMKSYAASGEMIAAEQKTGYFIYGSESALEDDFISEYENIKHETVDKVTIESSQASSDSKSFLKANRKYRLQ